VKLLLRYYEPTSGRSDRRRAARALKVESYRKHIGYVSQEAFLFSGTWPKNIRLGSPTGPGGRGGSGSDRRGDEFIRKLPEGYETRWANGA